LAGNGNPIEDVKISGVIKDIGDIGIMSTCDFNTGVISATITNFGTVDPGRGINLENTHGDILITSVIDGNNNGQFGLNLGPNASDITFTGSINNTTSHGAVVDGSSIKFVGCSVRNTSYSSINLTSSSSNCSITDLSADLSPIDDGSKNTIVFSDGWGSLISRQTIDMGGVSGQYSFSNKGQDLYLVSVDAGGSASTLEGLLGELNDGVIVRIMRVGGENVTIAHNAAVSAPFYLYGGTDVTLTSVGQTLTVMWDDYNSVWRQIGQANLQ